MRERNTLMQFNILNDPVFFSSQTASAPEQILKNKAVSMTTKMFIRKTKQNFNEGSGLPNIF